jgi:uncharacterized protein (DUF1499 family)
MLRRWLMIVSLVPGIAMASLFGNLFAGDPPPHVGKSGASLPPCPHTPNCVSSEATDDAHRIAPLAFTGSATSALARLAQVVAAQPGATVVAHRDDYLYATFTTPLMGFVDDVEFLLDRERGVLNVRSASRVGRGDFGVNRKRIETLRQAFKDIA